MIDVIIPCRNAPESLWLTLTHLWAYWSGDIASVVLLDNCSTDPRMKWIFHEVASRPAHSVIHHERDVGVWTSINRGLTLSRSRLAFILTSDVLIGPDLIRQLVKVQEITKQAYVGPDVLTGIGTIADLGKHTNTLNLVARYNGACWLMDWVRLEQEIGWYDPQFYVCFGDVDYVERLSKAALTLEDKTLAPAVVEGLYICHLDKQSRRADMTAGEDTEMEIKDGARFREKWAYHPDVLARHREISTQGYMNFKESDLGGWKTARVG